MAPLPAHLDHALWRADSLGRSRLPSCASGHPRLDTELPDGGWPGGALTELLLHTRATAATLCGQGELCLLGPALARLGRAGGEIALIAPPLHLHAPALAGAGWPLERLLIVAAPRLADAAWATEQALRSRRCAAVVWWTSTASSATSSATAPTGRSTGPAGRPDRSSTALLRLALRRLHLAAQDAAQDGAGLLFVLRDAACAAQSSPAPLRLLCVPDPASPLRLQVQLLKRRGPPCGDLLQLDTRAAYASSLGERLALLGSPAATTALLTRQPRPGGPRPALALPHALAQPAPAAAAA
jgi:protein ImuA